MFSLFKKSKKEQLKKKYKKLLVQAHELSTVNRKASDLKRAEAEAILAKIETSS